MRRHSLIGPLLLILIGLLFLGWNLRPELVSFRLISRRGLTTSTSLPDSNRPTDGSSPTIPLTPP